MEYRAVHKYAKTSVRKARQVVDLVRGHKVSDALSILQFTERRAADMLRKLIESAVANATYEAQRKREDVDPDELVIKRAFADDGPVQKRWRPRARGRAAPIQKRTSHLTVIIGLPEMEEEPAEEKPEKAAEAAAEEKAKAQKTEKASKKEKTKEAEKAEKSEKAKKKEVKDKKKKEVEEKTSKKTKKTKKETSAKAKKKSEDKKSKEKKEK